MTHENEPNQKSNATKILVIIGVIVVLAITVTILVPNQFAQNSAPVVKPLAGIKIVSQVFDDGIDQFTIEEIPEYSDKQAVQSSIDAAVSMWMESNPDLQLVQASDSGDFTIIWHQTIPGDHVGFQKGSQIDIELGSYDCNNNWNQYSEDNISEAIAHEIGHYLGLGHHSDETHLMYGNDEFTQAKFDDLGYTIPQQKLTELKWIGSENLEEQLEIINTKKTSLERSYENLSDEYDKYPQTISDPLVYEQALEMHQKLKDLYDIVDHTVTDYNRIVDELNCLANLE